MLQSLKTEATLSEKCSEDIQNIANSKLGVFCTNGNLVGSACIFACKDGLKISGSSVLVCQRDLKWSENIPTCTGIITNICTENLVNFKNLDNLLLIKNKSNVLMKT